MRVNGCQMAKARFLDRMCLALRAFGLWFCCTMLQNLIPSLDQILLCGNTARMTVTIRRLMHARIHVFMYRCNASFIVVSRYPRSMVSFFESALMRGGQPRSQTYSAMISHLCNNTVLSYKLKICCCIVLS